MKDKDLKKRLELLEEKFQRNIDEINERLDENQELRNNIQEMNQFDDQTDIVDLREVSPSFSDSAAHHATLSEAFSQAVGNIKSRLTAESGNVLSLKDKATVYNGLNRHNSDVLNTLVAADTHDQLIMKTISSNSYLTSVDLLTAIGVPGRTVNQGS